jgi:hypothetical protein
MNRQAMLIPPLASIIFSAVLHGLAFAAIGLLMACAVLGSAGWL